MMMATTLERRRPSPLYSRLSNRRLRVYPAPDLHTHVLNAASVETSRGLRLSKEKQSLKIDGAAALSFAVVAAEKSGRPLDPNEPSAPIEIISNLAHYREAR